MFTLQDVIIYDILLIIYKLQCAYGCKKGANF